MVVMGEDASAKENWKSHVKVKKPGRLGNLISFITGCAHRLSVITIVKKRTPILFIGAIFYTK
jgi:hypothetical protein